MRKEIPIKWPNDLVEGHEYLDCELPWITKEAVVKLDEELDDSDNVLEFGSGGSTIFFAKRCARVTSIETSSEWLVKTRAKLTEQGLENVKLILKFDENTVVESVWEYGARNITVVSIDTQGGIDRSRILRTVLKRTLPNLRMIILDNYGHEGLFPEHYDKVLEGWDAFTYSHERWAGNGTRIYIKRK